MKQMLLHKGFWLVKLLIYAFDGYEASRIFRINVLRDLHFLLNADIA